MVLNTQGKHRRKECFAINKEMSVKSHVVETWEHGTDDSLGSKPGRYVYILSISLEKCTCIESNKSLHTQGLHMSTIRSGKGLQKLIVNEFQVGSSVRGQHAERQTFLADQSRPKW